MKLPRFHGHFVITFTQRVQSPTHLQERLLRVAGTCAMPTRRKQARGGLAVWGSHESDLVIDALSMAHSKAVSPRARCLASAARRLACVANQAGGQDGDLSMPKCIWLPITD